MRFRIGEIVGKLYEKARHQVGIGPAFFRDQRFKLLPFIGILL